MNGRVYDYRIGRFLSVDPIISNPANPQAVNPYSYIGNNPLSGVDPTGYMPSCWALAQCAAGFFAQSDLHGQSGLGATPYNAGSKAPKGKGSESSGANVQSEKPAKVNPAEVEDSKSVAQKDAQKDAAKSNASRFDKGEPETQHAGQYAPRSGAPDTLGESAETPVRSTDGLSLKARFDATALSAARAASGEAGAARLSDIDNESPVVVVPDYWSVSFGYALGSGGVFVLTKDKYGRWYWGQGALIGKGFSASLMSGTLSEETSPEGLEAFLTGPTQAVSGGVIVGISVVSPMPEKVLSPAKQPFAIEGGLALPGIGAELVESVRIK